MRVEAEVKGIVGDLVGKLLALFDLQKSFNDVKDLIRNEYVDGLEFAEQRFNMNFAVDEDAVKFLQDYAFSNIKGLDDELRERLRKEITQGLINLEHPNALGKRLEAVFDFAEERARLIARTESARAQNFGALAGAKQSGLRVVKVWDSTNDLRECPVCDALDGQERGLEEAFVVDGKTFVAPPAHPRCRCALVFRQL